jgi:hypothetical protein
MEDIEKKINRLKKERDEEIKKIENSFKSQVKTMDYEKNYKIKNIETLYLDKIKNINKEAIEEKSVFEEAFSEFSNIIEEKIIPEIKLEINKNVKKEQSKTLVDSIVDLPLIGNIFGFAIKKYEEAKKSGDQHVYFLTLIASLFMLLGVFWGLDFVIEKGLITLEYRVILFGLLSVAMISGGIYFLKNNKILGLSLFGTGLLSFHFVFYFITSYYDIINLNIGFLFLTICSISAFYLSYKLKDNVVYFITMMATVTIPLFFSNTVIVNDYLSVFDIFKNTTSSISSDFSINQIVLIVSLFSTIFISTYVAVNFNWKKLLFLGFIVFGSLFDVVMTMNDFHHLLSLISINIISVLFISASLFHEYKNKDLTSVANKVYLFIISVFIYFVGNALYLSETFQIAMPIMLGFIIVNLMLLIVACNVSYKKNETLLSTFVLLTMSLIAIALFSVFDSSFKYFLFVESVIFIILAYRHNIKLIKIEALIMFAMSTINMFKDMLYGYDYEHLKMSSMLLFLSFVTSVFLFNYNKAERWICRLETTSLSVLSVFTFVIILVFNFNISDNYLLFGEALNFNLLIPVIAFSLIIFNIKKATPLIVWSYVFIISLVLIDIISLGKIPRLERILIISYLFGTAYLLIKNGSTEKIKKFGVWTQKFAFLLIPLGIVSFGIKHISHDYLSYIFLTGFIVAAFASKITPIRFNMNHLFNIEASVLLLISSLYFDNPLLSLSLLFFISFSLKKYQNIKMLKAGDFIRKAAFLLIPLSSLFFIYKLNLVTDLKQIAILGFIFTFILSKLFPLRFDLRKFYHIEASMALIYLASLYNFNIILIIAVCFYISYTFKQFDINSSEQASNRLGKVGFLLIPISLTYYAIELIKIPDEFIGLFISSSYFLTFYINKIVSKNFIEMSNEYKKEGILFLLVGSVISLLMIAFSSLIEMVPSMLSLALAAFMIYKTNLIMNSKIKKLFSSIFLISYYLLLTQIMNVYFAAVILIFNILLLSIKGNFEKIGMSKNGLTKLNIIFTGLSPILLFDYYSENILAYFVMANSLVFIFYFNNLNKNYKGMSFIFSFIAISNYLLLNSIGNGYISTYGVTFMMLVPCVYTFYSLFKYNYEKFNKISYIMAGIILLKFFVYDLSAMKEMREFILIGLGISLFIVTYCIKKKKKKEKL